MNELETIMRELQALMNRAESFLRSQRGVDSLRGVSKETAAQVLVIQEVVAAKFNVPLKYLYLRDRHSAYSTPRMLAMALSCRLVKMAQPLIAQAFQRDQSTLCHARRTIKARCETEPEFKALYDECLKTIQKRIQL
jgi:chromosomal replication initiator protein